MAANMSRNMPLAMQSTNLWQQMLRDCSVRTKIPTATLLMVGDAECGKTALLHRLDAQLPTPNLSTPPQSPADLDAKVSRRQANGAQEDTNVTSSASHHSVSSLVAYTSIDVLDPRVTEDQPSDPADDFIAHIKTWCYNNPKLDDLLPLAVEPDTIATTVVAIVVDLARPWTIKSSLDQWASTVEGLLLEQMNQLPPDARNELYTAIKEHLLNYEDPSIDHSIPTSVELATKKEFLEEGALTKNLGVPLVLVVSKADLRLDNSVKMDYIEYTLRQFAIRYGAAVVYTSAKSGSNLDLLRNYILHRAFPEQFPFDHAPQLVERGAIFIPAGYDSFALVEQSLVGSQPRWPMDKPFEKIVPTPHEESEDPALMSAEVRVDSHERWLEKLEKAAGAGLEELQKQSVEASKKAEAAATARRAAADRRKRDEKDVSSRHLANFFNDLLSRPEKSKSSRSMGDVKKKEKSGVKSLAEKELNNFSKRGGNAS